MSLIVCSECGKEFSDKASTCIHCGNPIYNEEHTNVVLLERSWIDLSDEEKNSLVCEYEKKTGLNMHYTFFCSSSCWMLIIASYGLSFLVLSLSNLSDQIVRFIFIISLLWVCGFSFLSYNIWQKHKGEINWNKVNVNKDFAKWLKSSKNIVK